MYNQVNIREAIPLSPDLRQEETMNDVIYNPIIPNDPDDPNDLAEAVEISNAKNMQPRNVNPGTQFHTKQGVNNSCNNFVVPMTSPSISPPQNTVIQSAKSSFIYIHMNKCI